VHAHRGQRRVEVCAQCETQQEERGGRTYRSLSEAKHAQHHGTDGTDWIGRTLCWGHAGLALIPDSGRLLWLMACAGLQTARNPVGQEIRTKSGNILSGLPSEKDVQHGIDGTVCMGGIEHSNFEVPSLARPMPSGSLGCLRPYFNLQILMNIPRRKTVPGGTCYHHQRDCTSFKWLVLPDSYLVFDMHRTRTRNKDAALTILANNCLE
jgi:hypothetical protein